MYSHSYNRHFYRVDSDSLKFVNIDFPDNIDSNEFAAVLTPNVIFNYTEDGSLCSYYLEDEENMKYSKLLNEKESLELFNNPEKYGLEGYTIDSEKWIFYNGLIQNRKYKTLYKYWKELHEKENKVATRIVPGSKPFEVLPGVSSSFRGYDKDHNAYYSSGNAVIIFDSNGWVLDYFKFKNKAFLKPTINYNGDIFFLSESKKEDKTILNLYKITRQW